MRILILANQLPHPTGFGTAVHLWAITHTLIKMNHEVHFCCYGYDAGGDLDPWYCMDRQLLVDELKAQGAILQFIPKIESHLLRGWAARMNSLKKLIYPSLKDYYSGAFYSEKISEISSNIMPDAIFAWTVDAVAAAQMALLCNIPCMVSLVDLDHFVKKHKKLYKPKSNSRNIFYSLSSFVAEKKVAQMTVSLLKSCDIVIDHAAHHCRWLQARGVRQAKYFPVFVLDNAGALWKENRLKVQEFKKRKRVSLVGNMNGIATLSGLYFFAREFLPELERRGVNIDFEFDIIGGGDLPIDLIDALDRPFINLRGYVENIELEYLLTDVLLVPTPIDLGFRTRISEGFSFGCCVVAHSANSAGMPELQDGKNSLLVSSGFDMVDAVLECLASPDLRYRLGSFARATFEAELNGHIACAKMVELLELLVPTPGSSSLAVDKN